MPQVMTSKKSGKPAKSSPAGREAKAIPSGDDVETVTIGSGATSCNRTTPCEPKQALRGTAAGETTVIIHGDGAGEPLENITAYLRSSGIVHRAMGLLADWKFRTARISCSFVPVDIIAFRDKKALLVQAIYSKTPVPDAKTVESRYKEKITSLRQMGTSDQFRKIVMVYSSKCGWKYYEVLPGGLIPAWDLPEIPEK
jgi:hypothetical protein